MEFASANSGTSIWFWFKIFSSSTVQLVFPKNYLTAFLAFGLLYFHGFRRCCVFMDFHVVVFSWISLLLYFHGVFREFRYIFMDFDVAVFPWNWMLLYFHRFLCCNSMDFDVLFTWICDVVHISMDLDVVFPWLHFLRFPWCPAQVPHISTQWEATLGNPEINYSNERWAFEN